MPINPSSPSSMPIDDRSSRSSRCGRFSCGRFSNRRGISVLMGALLSAVVLTACSTNPVTGKREVSLVGEDWELGIGEQQYLPLRQSQGGDYRVDPEVERYVSEVGQRLAKVSDRKLPYEFNVINDSTPNAWALPGGKISINRGLLVELKNEAELAAVLGHEVVHAAARHGAQGMTRGVGLQVGMAAVILGSRGKIDPNVAQIGAGVGAQLINSKYGRDAERESDRYGMEYMSRAGYDPQGAVGLQETFVELSKGRQQGRFAQWFASHPASTERVENNRKIAASLPAGGDLGTQRYRKAMARLIKSKPAYEAYDEARKAIKDGNQAEAVALVNKAIRLEPNEGHFHSFLGDVALEKNQLKQAKSYYDRAINLNNEFFYYYLRRGETQQKIGNNAAAKADLNRSMRLLPTPNAQAALGAIAKVENRRDDAIGYFQQAAAAGGAVGKAAQAELQALGAGQNPAAARQNQAGAAQNPAAAMRVRSGVKNGRLAVSIENPTSVDMNVDTIVLVNTAGRVVKEHTIRATVPARKRLQRTTDVRITPAQLQQLQVRVNRASPVQR